VEFFTKAFGTIGGFFQSLTPARKIAFVTLGVGVVVGIAGIFYWASRTSYAPLTTANNPSDATAIIRFLREKRIPFVVDETGKLISVPPEKVYDLRLELSSSGLAQMDVKGWDSEPPVLFNA
jgi:flagellar M-ring protein FliF